MSKRRSRQVSPFEFYGLASAMMVIIVAFLLYRRYSMDPIEAWLITANAVTILFFGYDKLLARSGRNRIPEKVLFGLSLIGGSPGGLVGMVLFWHKVKKSAFQRIFWAIVILQVIMACIWFFTIK